MRDVTLDKLEKMELSIDDLREIKAYTKRLAVDEYKFLEDFQ